MTLTQLSYIVAVDKYRHFATAAEKIYVTQPTLSMQIHKLEEQLGVKIFDRSKSPVIPTDIGENIIREAEKILKQARHIEDLARLSDGDLKGTYRVGVIPTIAPYLIPLFLRDFMEAWPQVELVFEEMLTGQVLDGLQDDTLDIGIIATPTDRNQIYIEELFNEPFVGFLSVDHPLARNETLHMADLDDAEIWLLNEGHCLRDQSMKLCKKERKNAKSPVRFESGNLETLKRLVEQNYGMTLMPALAVRDFNRNCSTAIIREFTDPAPSRKVRLAYSRTFLKQNIVRVFVDGILENLPSDLKLTRELIVIE